MGSGLGGCHDFPSTGQDPCATGGCSPTGEGAAQQPGDAGGGSSPCSQPVSEVAAPRATSVAATSCYEGSSVLKIALYHQLHLIEGVLNATSTTRKPNGK